MKLFKYFLVFFLFALSGNRPIYTLLQLTNQNVTLIIFSLTVLLIAIFHYRRLKASKDAAFSFKIYSAAFILITFIQIYTKGSIPFGTIMLYYLVAAYPFFLTLLYKYQVQLVKTINEIAVFLIKMSLVFWIPAFLLDLASVDIFKILPKGLLFGDVQDLGIHTHLIIHNFRSSLADIKQGGLVRNCGMFWEPGAFAGIIAMSFIYFNSIKLQFTPKQRKKYFRWYMAGMLSTFSTGGLLIIPIMVVLYYIERVKKGSNVFKYAIGFIMFLAAFYVFYQINPLLNQKINEQFTSIQSQDDQYELTRVGNIIFLYAALQDNFVLGIGMNNDWSRDAIFNKLDVLDTYTFGNGMMDYLVKFGLPMFILFLYLFIRNTRNLVNSNITISRILIFLIIFLTLQDETWLNFPFMFSFLYFTSVKKKQAIIVKQSPQLQEAA